MGESEQNDQPTDDLTARTLRGSAFNVTASLIQAVIQFGRSIVLARLLEPEVFGIYAFATSWVAATAPVAQFGLGSGLLHRARESEGEMALRVHFTLSLIFSLIWAVGLACAAPFIIPDSMSRETLWILWIFIGAKFLGGLSHTSQVLLIRRVVFRRIALVNTVGASLSTAASVALAWHGYGVWSLVATNLIGQGLILFGYLLYRPVWRPQLGWSWPIARYLLSFGGRSFVGGLLSRALDKVDDLWTGWFLGEVPMGFYARAYRFATYPRAVLAGPVASVAAGTYAELKGKRRELSQAFFRVNAFLVRVGFLAGGLLALLAPELIRLVIGAKWLPMLTTFRLMLVFTLLDPIKGTVASLFVAEGCPEKTVEARFAQLLVLVSGLFFLGHRWGIDGVALAVDMMMVVGLALLLWQAKAHVDFSILLLFGGPAVALAVAMLAGRAAIALPGVLGSPWRTGAVKTTVFLVLYPGVLLILERKQARKAIETGRRLLVRGLQGRKSELGERR